MLSVLSEHYYRTYYRLYYEHYLAFLINSLNGHCRDLYIRIINWFI